jgi:hypothetical protein
MLQVSPILIENTGYEHGITSERVWDLETNSRSELSSTAILNGNAKCIGHAP